VGGSSANGEIGRREVDRTDRANPFYRRDILIGSPTALTDMYEVEVKVAADHDAVRQRLPDDAEAMGTVEQVDTYFDAPHRNFAQSDEALRLRRERPAGDGEWTTAVTYKGPLLEAESKSREEFETEVAEGETMQTVFERLGFERAAEVRKERDRYAVGEFTVTFDTVYGLGEYVEVETERDDAGISDARDAARDVLTDLGCDPDDQIRTSYLGLLLAEE